MEANHDLAFYGDTVLPSDDDEMDETPQATLKLLTDFPDPLTEPQRRVVQRYVARQVREFEHVRRQVAVVETGYLALLRLVKRLRKEQAKLQASLSDDADTRLKTPTTTEAPRADGTVSTTAAAAVTSSTVASKETTTAPKRRPGGLLLRSSVFSGLQRVLQTAKTEQHDEKVEQLARQRERIAKESRLHLVSQDLASQEALLEPLKRKYSHACAMAEEAANQARPLMALLEDMWRLETLYPSRFTMCAAGSLEPLMWSPKNVGGSAGANEVNEEKEVGGDAEKSGSGDASQPASAANAAFDAVPFMVPFAPAQYTSEVEDVIRAQVEDIIDEYLAYRTRIDLVLYQLEQAQQAAKTLKMNQLMDAIGIKGTEAGAEVLPLGGITAAGGAGLLSNPLAGKSVETMLHISSSDEDEDVVESGVAGEDAADKDRQDREQIRTALTALDDFEDA